MDIDLSTIYEIVPYLNLLELDAFLMSSKSLYTLRNNHAFLRNVSYIKNLPYVSSFNNLLQYRNISQNEIYVLALKIGDLRIVRNYIERGGIMGINSINIAAIYGNINVVKYLINVTTKTDIYSDDYYNNGRLFADLGYTTIENAVSSNNLELVKYVTESVLNSTVKRHQDYRLEIYDPTQEIKEYLTSIFKDIEVTYTNIHDDITIDYTPKVYTNTSNIIIAAQEGNTELVKQLITDINMVYTIVLYDDIYDHYYYADVNLLEAAVVEKIDIEYLDLYIDLINYLLDIGIDSSRFMDYASRYNNAEIVLYYYSLGYKCTIFGGVYSDIFLQRAILYQAIRDGNKKAIKLLIDNYGLEDDAVQYTKIHNI